jgi:outer membrane protein OmpA-like peptidoglycan-associated protein
MKWLRSFELTQGQWPENLKLQIEGHTDSEGSSAGNYQLSLQRAQQVLGLASKMGFGAHRMEVFGWGSKFASGEVQEDRRVIVRWVQY